MRILLAHKFHHLTGGAELFYFETARALHNEGHTVGFFTTEDERNIESEHIFTVAPPKFQSNKPLEKIGSIKNIFMSNRAEIAMLDAISRFSPDILHVFAIHTHLTPSILRAAKAKNVPVAMSCNDYKHICPNYKLFDGHKICYDCKGGRFYKAALKKCAHGSTTFSVASAIESYAHNAIGVYDKYVDKYLFASQFMLDKTKEFWPDKNLNYGILKNPFDANEYIPNYQGEYALYFGRIIEEKGVDRIISAAKDCNIPIKIVGDGPALNALQTECISKNISNVEFLGPKWGKDLSAILDKAAFVIVPSIWHENFPYVVFQAFASGKPVVGSNRGGIPELVTSERGAIFEPDSIAELATKMQELWENPGAREVMGKNARHFVETEFTEQKFYNDLIGHYESVL